jgi:hypothetical protein
MPQFMKKDIPLNPTDIAPFRSDAIVPNPDFLPNHVQKFFSHNVSLTSEIVDIPTSR